LNSVLDEADEVVVVDNGSPGEAVSNTARGLGARVVRLSRNRGFAAGVNVGVRVARGEVIGLLNDDAFADPGWLRVCGNLLEDRTIAAVAPKILFAWHYAEVHLPDEPKQVTGDPRSLGRCLYHVTLNGQDVLATLVGPGIHRLEEGIQGTELSRWRWTTGRKPFYVPLPDEADPATLRFEGEAAPVTRIVRLINNAGSYLSAEGHGGDYGYRAPDDGGFDDQGDRFAATGAAMVILKDAFHRIGHFAVRYFAYYEDTDWCWRAQLAGLRVRYEPRAVVHHVGGVTSGGEASQWVRFLAARNRIDTLTRNAPLFVLRQQLRRTLTEEPSKVRRAVLARLPRGVADRIVHSRRWRVSPGDVWSRWAGVGEQWEDRATKPGTLH
jgi:GT2 family glycosyltransferase